MKNDLFSIGKIVIHGYGLMIGIGIACCILLGLYRAKKQNKNGEAVLDIAIISILTGFLGAKLLFVLVDFKQFLQDPLSVLGSEGFVVYGGIIAGVLCTVLYCRRKHLVFLEYFDLLAPSIALAQGFGRIGCFFAGCCYGRPSDSCFSVVFPPGAFAPSGIPLLPTQLFSSAGDFLIVILLLLYEKKSRHVGNVGAMYLLLYGIGRFLIEILRYDERGAVGIFSTSQLISIAVTVFALFLFRKNKSRAERES